MKKKIVLITDFVQTEGLSDDVHNLSMWTVYVKDHLAWWEDGILAESHADLNRCIKNAYKHFDLTLNEAINLTN